MGGGGGAGLTCDWTEEAESGKRNFSGNIALLLRSMEC